MTEPHTLGKAILSEKTITGTTDFSLSVIEYKENPIFLDTIYTDELLLSAALSEIFGETFIKRATVRKKYEYVGSSIDRTPARQNMYVNPPNRQISTISK